MHVMPLVMLRIVTIDLAFFVKFHHVLEERVPVVCTSSESFSTSTRRHQHIS